MINKNTKYVITLLVLAAVFIFNYSTKTKKFEKSFFGSFDTISTITVYTNSESNFNEILLYAESRLAELNNLFDIYNTYEGVNNLKTINDNAGIKPVAVSNEIIDLLILCKQWHQQTNGKVNVAFGSVLKIWHNYREAASPELENNEIPTIKQLQEANKHTDINNIEINYDSKTVFLKDPKMSIDVGAVAKGYAAELVTEELLLKGYNSFIVNLGGNVRVTNKKGGFNIAINANNSAEKEVINIVNSSVVTSGNYNRFFMSNGKQYHHLIDPNTLFPANYYKSVTVVYKNSTIADMLSTALFLMPEEETYKLLELYEGAKAFFHK